MKSFKIVLALFLIVHHVNSQGLTPEIVHRLLSGRIISQEEASLLQNVLSGRHHVCPGGDAPTMTLYKELDQKDMQLTLTGPSKIHFAPKSISGKGLWFLYRFHDFTARFRVIASASITNQNLDASHWSQTSSLRNAGSDDMCMEILTMYNDADQGGGSYVVVQNMDGLLGFNDKASSFAITGNSAWTLYSAGYSGHATCIEPYEDDGFFYGYWNAGDINMPDNVVSTVKKGCHSPNVYKFQP